MIKFGTRPLIRSDWKLISDQQPIIEVCYKISDKNKFTFQPHANDSDFLKSYNFSYKPTLLVIDALNIKSLQEVLERVSLLKSKVKRVVFCLLASQQLLESSAELTKEFDFILDSNEFSSELFEYFLFYKIKGEMFSVSIQDVYPSTEIPFNVYQLTEVTRKILPVIFHRLTLAEKKFTALQSSEKPLVIKRPDVKSYRKYIEHFFDKSDFGMKKRIRAQIFEFLGVYFDLKSSLWLHRKSEHFEERFKEYSLCLHQLLLALQELKAPWHSLMEHYKHDFLRYDSTWFCLVGTLFSFQKLGKESEAIELLRLAPFLQSFENRGLREHEWALLDEKHALLLKEFFSENPKSHLALSFFLILKTVYVEVVQIGFEDPESLDKLFQQELKKASGDIQNEALQQFLEQVQQNFFLSTVDESAA